MADLFNIDINQIKHNGNEVLLMKLNGNIIYERETFRIEYTVASVDRYLNEKSGQSFDGSVGAFGVNYYGLPRIYSRYGKDIVNDPYSDEDDCGVYSYNYSKVEITKKDGTITSNLSTKCNEISKVKLWYPETTEAIRFIYKGDAFGSAVERITYCNMSNFISANYMFHDCDYYLRSIKNVGKWRTKNLTDMSYMFSCGYSDYTRASYLEEIDLSNVNTTSAIDMSSMFYNCDKLTTLDLSSFNTSNVTDMSFMFADCDMLTTLNLSNFYIANITNMSYMFRNCNALQEVRLDNCSNDTISKIIAILPTGDTNTERIIYCKEKNAINLTAPKGWIFSFNVNEEEPDVPDIPENPEVPDTRPLYEVGEFKSDADITTAQVMVDTSHTDLSYMFYNCTSLKSVNTESWNTSNVTNMGYMFYNCNDLLSLDLSSFNTSQVTSMYWMFFSCTSLTELDLSNFDTSNVTTMSNMFRGCENLHTLRLDNCSDTTISMINAGLPTNTITDENGAIIPRVIYCKEENAADLTAPTNWQFSYID